MVFFCFFFFESFLNNLFYLFFSRFPSFGLYPGPCCQSIHYYLTTSSSSSTIVPIGKRQFPSRSRYIFCSFSTHSKKKDCNYHTCSRGKLRKAIETGRRCVCMHVWFLVPFLFCLLAWVRGSKG